MRSYSALPTRARAWLACAAFIPAGLMCLPGCATDGPSRSERRRQESAQRPLAGSVAFLDGSLDVAARLGRFDARPPRSDGDAVVSDAGGERMRRRGGGGGGGEFRGSAGGMGMGGSMELGSGEGPPPRGEMGGEAHFGGVREGAPGPMLGFPRQTLRLSLTNRGRQPLKLDLVELRSALGNFSPRPERVELAPGMSTELDPVSGDAGGALESLEVVFSIRRGEETLSQTIRLVPTGEPAPRTLARE